MAITKMYLLNVPLENDYKNTLYFTSKAAQQQYFQSRIIKSYTDFSYQRKDRIVRIPEQYDNLYNINYVMYQNSNYSNKWFYAFVTNMEYINDGRTDLHIETDVIQTWLFDYVVKPSFIEREHVSDDTVGLNTIDEDLDIGQLICDREKKDETFHHASEWYWIVVACNYDPSNNTRYAGVGLYGEYPQGSMWFAFPIYPLASDTGINTLSDWIFDITDDGHPDDIQTMFAVPWSMINYSDVDETTHKLTNGKGNKINEIQTFVKSSWRSFSDFTPRNKKVYCYPYSFMRVTNNMGAYNDYKFEDFHTLDIEGESEVDEVNFNVIATPCQGVSGKLRPMDYQGIDRNEDESLQLGKFPTFSWASDGFTNWLTQNAINIGLDIAGGAAAAVGAGATGNVAGAVGSLSGMIGNTIGGLYKASMIPNTAKGNANAGDVSFNFNIISFKFLHMRPRKEQLQVIDDYFTMFGYKSNRVKTPNVAHRQRWWYTKTIDVNIDGSIPQIDLQKIKDCYNNGITFWRNAAEIQNYALSNNPI